MSHCGLVPVKGSSRVHQTRITSETILLTELEPSNVRCRSSKPGRARGARYDLDAVLSETRELFRPSRGRVTDSTQHETKGDREHDRLSVVQAPLQASTGISRTHQSIIGGRGSFEQIVTWQEERRLGTDTWEPTTLDIIMDPNADRVNSLLANLRASQAANARRRQGFAGPPPPPTIYAPGVHNLESLELSERSNPYIRRRNRDANHPAAPNTDAGGRRLSESRRPPPGPKPPASWKVLSSPAGSRSAATDQSNSAEPYPTTPEGRIRALSPLLSSSSLSDRESCFPICLTGGNGESESNSTNANVLSLQTLTLRVIVAEDLPSRWPTSFVSSLPTHIRSRIALEGAIWAPFGARALNALYAPRDMTRLIICGPGAPTDPPFALRSDRREGPHHRSVGEIEDALLGLLRKSGGRLSDSNSDSPAHEHAEPGTWDESSDNDSEASSLDYRVSGETNSARLPVPLTSLVLLNLLPRSPTIYELLPYTLTSLVISASPTLDSRENLPISTPFHLLSRTLPLLTYLSVAHTMQSLPAFCDLPWESRWKEMKVLCVKRCLWLGTLEGARGSREVFVREKVHAINERRPTGRCITFQVD